MTPARRRLLDLAFAFWVIIWLALAVEVAVEVHGLRELSETVKRTGVAVRETGDVLVGLADTPIVGESIREPGESVRQAGRSAIASGESSSESIRELSVLLAIVIAVMPIVAVLGVYLQRRSLQAKPGAAVRARSR